MIYLLAKVHGTAEKHDEDLQLGFVALEHFRLLLLEVDGLGVHVFLSVVFVTGVRHVILFITLAVRLYIVASHWLAVSHLGFLRYRRHQSNKLIINGLTTNNVE